MTKPGNGGPALTDISIREASEDDVPRILAVLKVALGETPLLKRTPELWAWKHRLNPHGPSIVLVATSGDEIVGVRAFMRWELLTAEGEPLSCMRPVDTATHPEFLRRGIFRNLTLSALDVARNQGVQLVFNTPNNKSAPGYLKMGWEEVAPIGVLARIKARLFFGAEAEEPPDLAQALPIGQAFESVMPTPSDRPLRGLRTRRDARYLSWRFTQHPAARYAWVAAESGGGLVCRTSTRNGRPELVVSDLLGRPPASIVRATARSSRCAYMAGWFSMGSPERSTAIRGGMVPVPGVKTLRLVALPLAELPVDVHDIANWDFAVSDMELL